MRTYSKIGLLAFTVVTISSLAIALQVDEGKIADRQALADQKVKAAEKVLAILDLRQAANEPLTPTFVDLMATWNRRLFDAQVDAATGQEAKIAAAKAFVQRTNTLNETLKNVRGNLISAPMGEYHLSDAQLELAKLQSQ